MFNILIMGAGAIGCFVGGSLAASGHHVTLVGRPALMTTVEANGLMISWPQRTAQQSFPKTTTTIPPNNHYDFVILAVKSPATAAAADELAALPLDETHIVSLQNGIGNEEILANKFGPQKIIAGTITIPIQIPNIATIAVSKDKGGLGLAPLAPGQPVNQLAAALNSAGLHTVTFDNYRAMKWSKLLLNIINNASSAILNQTPAQIIEQPPLFNLEIAALQEAVTVMKKQGIPAVNLPGYPAQWLARLVSARWLPLAAKRSILRPFMVSGRGTKMPSLYLDLSSGRRTSEIDALNGAIVNAGKQFGVPTPANTALTQILNGLIAGTLDWADYQNQPDKLLQTATN